MTKSELEHIWYSVTSALENEFRARGWLPPQAVRIEALEAALGEVVKMCDVRIHRLSLFDEIQQYARAALEQDK